MNWGVVMKVLASVVGFALLASGNSYQQNPDAPMIAHGAAIAVAVGGYLVGLFQARPARNGS